MNLENDLRYWDAWEQGVPPSDMNYEVVDSDGLGHYVIRVLPPLQGRKWLDDQGS